MSRITKSSGTPRGRLWAERILGIEVSGAMSPLLGVSLVSSLAFSALWSFVGIWAIRVLDAPPTIVGIMYAGDAAASAFCGYYGGRLSDQIGRRAVMAGAWVVQAWATLSLALVGHHLALGVAAVIIAGAASGPGLAAANALVADLSDAQDSTGQFGAFRVAANLGAMAGPALGGWALIGEHWLLFFGGIAGMGLIAAGLAWRWLPSPVVAIRRNRGLGNRIPHLGMWRDTPFLLLLMSVLGGYLVYVGFDVVLPIVAVQDYGLKPALWGLLAAANPLMVVLLQGRLSRWMARYPVDAMLLASVSLMGFSFALLLVHHGATFVLASLLLFAVGEMTWAPTTQAFAARLSSDDHRGTYMGALGAASSAAWIVGPVVDLRLAATIAGGVWILLAGLGLGAGLLGWFSAQLAKKSSHLRPTLSRHDSPSS